jgi:hypothetical protein
VSADTRPGGDKWAYSLNDPFPDWRIRSWHLEGVRDASPRLNLSGPLIKDHLYFVEGFEYLVNNAEVRTLPFPMDETRSSAVNSFTQVDAVLDSRNTITATLHFSPHSIEYANLNYFDPQPVTPNADYQENTGTITYRFAIGEGLLTSTFAGTRVATNIDGQAQSDMVLSPVGNSGSYFGQQVRESTRFQWLETWSPANVRWHGQHLLQFGGVLAHAEDEGTVTGRDVGIINTSGQLLQTISFAGNDNFSLSDFEPALYAQDHWIMDKHLAMDAGIRFETQSLTHTSRFAPRWGLAWSPWGDSSTIIRGGLGIFYDSIPLETYAFSRYPEQVITTYDGSGNITDGPRQFVNLISQSPSRFPFIHQLSRNGNFAPYSFAWNIEAERIVNQYLSLRLRYLHSDANNQLILSRKLVGLKAPCYLPAPACCGPTKLNLPHELVRTRTANFSSRTYDNLLPETLPTRPHISETSLSLSFDRRSQPTLPARSQIDFYSGVQPTSRGECISGRALNIAMVHLAACRPVSKLHLTRVRGSTAISAIFHG